MKSWALGFITLGALGVLHAPTYLVLWILRGTGPLSDQAQLTIDHLGSIAMLTGIGLIVLGAVMWIVEPEPLFSAKETRRHHIVAAAVAAVSAVFMLMTVVPDESPWKRWSGVVICAVLVVQSLWKAVRFPPTPRP